MRRGVLIGLIVLLPTLAMAHNGMNKTFSVESSLKALLSTDHYNRQSIKSFESFLDRLDKKHSNGKSKHAFIRQVFSKTHQRFLKSYTAYATLNETFEKGVYNCLTGTILFSLILHHYNIQHQVIETNYHIFILAETSEGQVLLETTDPLNGFVTSTEEIKARINVYKQNELQEKQQDKSYYKFRFELYNAVSIDELRGLLYYNKAVNSFNEKKLEAAVHYLAQANELYSSHRIAEFSQILVLSLQQSDLALKTKENCINAILLLQQKSLPFIIASN